MSNKDAKSNPQKKPRSKSATAKRNNQKGKELELQVANDLKKYYPKARRTGFNFKLLDDCKVDVAFVPWNIQCKNGYPKSRPKADVIFKEMGKLLEKTFEPDDKQLSHPKVLVHKIDGYRPEHNLVTLQYSDFLKLLDKIYELEKGSEFKE